MGKMLIEDVVNCDISYKYAAKAGAGYFPLADHLYAIYGEHLINLCPVGGSKANDSFIVVFIDNLASHEHGVTHALGKGGLRYKG